MVDDAALRPDLRAWPGVVLGPRVAGGNRTPVFHAARGSERFVVRVSSRPAESLVWELDLLETLTAAGIAVPRTVATADGGRHHHGVVLQSFLPGRPPVDVEDWTRVAATVGRVHEVTAGRPQRPGFASARELLTGDRGGDVDLAAMPADVVALLRAAWRPVAYGPQCVVHGDVSPGNVLVTADGVALLDWDEARVDVPAFDFAGLPPDVPVPAGPARDVLRTAGIAWEVAACWRAEPEYAAVRLAELRGR